MDIKKDIGIGFKNICNHVRTNWLAYFCLIICAVITISSSNQHFWEHFPLELSILLFGIFLGLILVDRYHKEKWNNMKFYIYFSIINYLYKILEGFATKFPEMQQSNNEIYYEIITDPYSIYRKNSNVFLKISNFIKQKSQQELNISGDNISRFYDEIKSELNAIRYLFGPILIQHPEDEKIFNTFIEYDRALVLFQKSQVFNKESIPTDLAKSLSLLIEKAGELYKEIYQSNSWEKKIVSGELDEIINKKFGQE